MKVKYNKLVRDNVPAIIQNEGKKCETRIVDGDNKLSYLFDKLFEEANELKESKTIDEIADVLEVLDSIILELKLDKQAIVNVKETKRKERGGFSKGIVLLSVDEQQ